MMTPRRKKVCLAAAAWLLGVVGSAISAESDEPPLVRFSAAEPHMGVPFSIVLYAPDESTANRAFAAAFARIKQLDGILSDYDENSELSRLGASAPHEQAVRAGDDLWNVLWRAQAISRASDGAFDITVGPLSRLWRRARRLTQLPSPQSLQEALAAVGYKHVELDEKNHTVRLARPGMKLDAGGIAKGYAADEALRVLRGLNLPRATVAAAGDIAVGEPPPDATGWRIAVAPLAAGGPESRRLLLARCGVSTSGDAFQFVEIDGKRYSHIVDPRTGMGLVERGGVSVVAPDATASDALATAACVLGPVKGLGFIDRIEGAAALVVHVVGDKVEVGVSRQWRDTTGDPGN